MAVSASLAIGVATGVAIASSANVTGPMPAGVGVALAVLFLVTFGAGVSGALAAWLRRRYIERKHGYKLASFDDPSPMMWGMGAAIWAMLILGAIAALFKVLS